MLKCVEAYEKFINKNNPSIIMLRGNIAVSSLKILWKKSYSVKCYDKSSMKVFTLK